MRPFFLVLCLDRIYGIDMDKEKLKTDKKLELMEEICEIADGLTLDYVKDLRKTIKDPDADDAQKCKAYREMDKVLRITKQYSERVLLAEGKNTSNIGIDGKGGLPFKFVINKHYPEGSGQQSAISNELEEKDSGNEVTGDKCEGENDD